MKKIYAFIATALMCASAMAQAPTSVYLRNSLIFSDNERTPITLSPIVDPTSASAAVTWISSDPAVATVADGVVTPVAPGTAEIIATSAEDATKAGKCAVTVLKGDNLVADWDGNEIVGEGSEMDRFGWSCTLNADTTQASGYTFQPTTGTSGTGMRYDPQRKMANSAGTAYVRTAILRLKSTTTTQYPVMLEAGKAYKFTANVAYGSVGQTYGIKINTDKSCLGTTIGTWSVTTTVKNTLMPVTIDFEAQETGIHYICFTTTNGATQNCFVTDMMVQAVAAEAPTAIDTRSYLQFFNNKSTPVSLATIITPATASKDLVWECDNDSVATVVDGVVTPVAPGTAIVKVASAENPAVSAQCRVTVYDGDNMVANWDGNETVGEGSEMNLFGWSVTDNATGEATAKYNFQPTNGSDPNYNDLRYDPMRKMADATGSVYVRTAILRLDNTTTTQYPVTLKADKSYRLNLNVAYGSNNQTYTVSVNSQKSCLGTSLGAATIQTNGTTVKTNTLYPVEIDFLAKESGEHYICFGSASAGRQNGFVTDMMVQPIEASVTLHYVDADGNVLKPDVKIDGLSTGQSFIVGDEYLADFEIDGKTWYFDINESANYIEQLAEGDNLITLIYTDVHVVPESTVTVYYRDAAGNDVREPKVITGLTPGESFQVESSDTTAISANGNVYLYDAANSTAEIAELVKGNGNKVELRFDLTTMYVRSTLFFFANVQEPAQLSAVLSPKAHDVRWECDDESVVTVEDGLVTPVAPGVAIVTAVAEECDDLRAECLVIVKGTENLMAGWDGGDCVGEGSELSNFGWTCTLDSDPENGTTGYTFDTTEGSSATAHRYDPMRKMTDDLGKPFYGRTAIIRAKKTTTMNYPVELVKGKSYRLSGRVMYNANDQRHNIGVYTQESRQGTCLKTTTIATGTGITNRLQPINLTFTAKADGTHYVAFSNESAGTLTAFLVDLYVEQISAQVTVRFVDENWEEIKESVIITDLTPNNSYNVSRLYRQDFEQDGYLYVYNPNSFYTVDNLKEGNNEVILQFTRTEIAGISDVAIASARSIECYSITGRFVDRDIQSLPRGIYIVRMITADGTLRTMKVNI